MKISNFTSKIFHRAKIISKICIDSLKMLGLRKWLNFWILNENKIRLQSLNYIIRNESFVEKISDLAMVFETSFYRHYKICEINSKDTVIDIGAHIGGFTLLAAQSASKGKFFLTNLLYRRIILWIRMSN